MVAYKSGATNPPRNAIVFSDLPMSFIPNPITGNVKALKNEQAIKRAVRNLILTNKYERQYSPNKGGNITALLFEEFSSATRLEVIGRIRDIIEVYEPRAEVQSVDVNQQDDLNTIKISIVFRPLNQIDSTELSFTVERVR